MKQLDDPHLWLEDVYAPAALEWVKSKNQFTLAALKSEPIHATFENEIRAIVQATDRLPSVTERAGYFYNFWQDKQNPKGLWRRCKVNDYARQDIPWETVLDIDELSKIESESWVFKHSSFLAPQFERCLVSLSRGGKDASVFREFDVVTKSFVRGGFQLPEAKSDGTWIDENTLIVGSDFGPGSLTNSGYPRTLRVWKRGEAVENARVIFECEAADMVCNTIAVRNNEGFFTFVSRRFGFYESELYYLNPHTFERTVVPVPKHAEIANCVGRTVIYQLRKDWLTFKAGSLVGLDYGEADLAKVTLIWEPTERSSLLGSLTSKNAFFVETIEDVHCRLFHVDLATVGAVRERELAALAGRAPPDGAPALSPSGQTPAKLTPIPLPPFSVIDVMSCSVFSDNILLTEQSFLRAPRVLSLQKNNAEYQPIVLKSLPSRFDEGSAEVQQHFVTSKDGTKVPYFLIHKKGIQLNSANPTLLTAYGGFEISRMPYYLATTGKAWIERGGVFALANIRGGGEYGPRWHQAALREKRQNAYDDFFAVAEDLIRRKITSPRRLGIQGGSNGGLLMGVAYTQRPELFNAVVCQVPLLDMLRYHKLLAGHSWVAEYGNPDHPSDKDFIEKYSPYQNIKAGQEHPKIFFVTSTADDRVHPGHARKMAARLEELAKDFYYYENMEGGHAGAADPEQVISKASLELTYLYQQLMK